jgi:transcriptional regulator with XRE-family HTH domain
MEDAGQRLRRARERLDLRVRDVELASQQIAERHKNREFTVMISRLSEIENHHTLPSIYRLYSLCCIYRLDLNEVLTWYGVPVASLASDAGMVAIGKTHPVDFDPDTAEVLLPISLNPGVDLRRTFFVTEVIQRWGKLPLALISGADIRRYRYGFVGTDDWNMSPAVPAGSLLVIDDTKRKIQSGGWSSQAERPLYFVQHRDGYFCRWCSVRDDMISLIPDPSSEAPVLVFPVGEVDIIGQVIGLAISLDHEKRPRNRP